MKNQKYILRTLVLGSLSGMRSIAGIAFTSVLLSRNPSKLIRNPPLSYIQNPSFSKVVAVTALGELIGDKLPFAPNRTDAALLAGRILLGGITGAILFKAEAAKPIHGFILGAACALAVTFGSFYLRKAAADTKQLPDFILGLIEDAVVVGLGAMAIR